MKKQDNAKDHPRLSSQEDSSDPQSVVLTVNALSELTKTLLERDEVYRKELRDRDEVYRKELRDRDEVNRKELREELRDRDEVYRKDQRDRDEAQRTQNEKVISILGEIKLSLIRSRDGSLSSADTVPTLLSEVSAVESAASSNVYLSDFHSLSGTSGEAL